ncbi:E3 ubiquitin-protein ligase RNF14-like [Gastrophryne carolinensis]
MSAENQEAQEDELLALTNIYSEDEFKRDDTAHGGEIQVCPELPPDFEVSIQSNAAANVVQSFKNKVLFLPPLVLNFELPPAYPSTTPPIYTLSCKWLSSQQLTLLCQHLDDLWEENKGCVVLFAWMQFLKEKTLEYLNIKSPYQIQVCSTPSWSQTSENANLCDAGAKSAIGEIDRRAIQDVQSVSALIKYILDFNESQQKKCFDSKVFLCNICFCEKLGSEGTYFKACSHVYCNSCLKDYFEIQIRDGQVHALNCPEPKCTSVPSHGQVKELVGEQLFSRYDRLLLQSTLDLMSDVVHCPRPSCHTPVMLEPGETMAICLGCQYAFCTLCRKTYHGVYPCELTSEELALLRDDYLAADKEGKRCLEKQYGKHIFQISVEELRNMKWLQQNSKSCPRCGTFIQKIDGCNKMTCSRCGQLFCWLCAKELSKNHFNDSSSGCYERGETASEKQKPAKVKEQVAKYCPLCGSKFPEGHTKPLCKVYTDQVIQHEIPNLMQFCKNGNTELRAVYDFSTSSSQSSFSKTMCSKVYLMMKIDVEKRLEMLPTGPIAM